MTRVSLLTSKMVRIHLCCVKSQNLAPTASTTLRNQQCLQERESQNFTSLSTSLGHSDSLQNE